MVCLRNICINTLHKGDNDDDDDYSNNNNNNNNNNNLGRDSVVGIAIRYGLDDPGIECRSGLDFPHLFKPLCSG